MKLLYHPGQNDEGGKLLPIPISLRKNISSWASASYFEYPFGYSLIQQFLAKRFSIHIWRIRINQSGKLYPCSDGPTIALQFMLKGSIPCILIGYGPKLLQKSKCGLFYVPVSVNEAWFEPGDYESLHIELEPGFLEDIAASFAGANELLNRFNQSCENGIPMISVAINYGAKAIIRNILECRKKGGDLLIDMHRYIVELLSEYVAGIREQEKEDEIKNVPHKEILLKIKNEIMLAPHIHKQKISTLSEDFGINRTELKKSFTIIFGVSPGSFIRFHALTKAHFIIAATNRNIDDVADEVGYSYRINFDKAFKKQFGYLPSKLRGSEGNPDQIH